MTSATVTQKYRDAYAAESMSDGVPDSLILLYAKHRLIAALSRRGLKTAPGRSHCDDPRWRWLAQVIVTENSLNHPSGLYDAIFAGTQSGRARMRQTERNGFWLYGFQQPGCS